MNATSNGIHTNWPYFVNGPKSRSRSRSSRRCFAGTASGVGAAFDDGNEDDAGVPFEEDGVGAEVCSVTRASMTAHLRKEYNDPLF